MRMQGFLLDWKREIKRCTIFPFPPFFSRNYPRCDTDHLALLRGNALCRSYCHQDAVSGWCGQGVALEVTKLAGSFSVVPTHTKVIISPLYLFLTHTTSAVTGSLSCLFALPWCWRMLFISSLSLSISVPHASLQPAYLLSLIAGSVISQQPWGEIAQELLLIFHLFNFILPLCALLFIFLPTDLKQLAAQLWQSRIKSTRIFNTALS